MMLALLLAAATPAAAMDSPRGFVIALYARYRNRNYSPFKHPGTVFAPPLLAAINEDSRLNQGEVGYLDGDPLCQCQDFERITATITGYQKLTPGLATVRVHVDLGLGQARDLKLRLARTRAGWRVADVSSDGEASLLAALEQANRKLKAGARK
jgi:hypothetical protein